MRGFMLLVVFGMFALPSECDGSLSPSCGCGFDEECP